MFICSPPDLSPAARYPLRLLLGALLQAAPSKDVLDGLIISGVCRVGGVLELKHVSGEPLSQELQVVWHKCVRLAIPQTPSVSGIQS